MIYFIFLFPSFFYLSITGRPRENECTFKSLKSTTLASERHPDHGSRDLRRNRPMLKIRSPQVFDDDDDHDDDIILEIISRLIIAIDRQKE